MRDVQIRRVVWKKCYNKKVVRFFLDFEIWKKNGCFRFLYLLLKKYIYIYFDPQKNPGRNYFFFIFDFFFFNVRGDERSMIPMCLFEKNCFFKEIRVKKLEFGLFSDHWDFQKKKMMFSLPKSGEDFIFFFSTSFFFEILSESFQLNARKLGPIF